MALRAILAALLALTLLSAESIAAHPGGVNKQGCHNDRKNGSYHCHSRPGTSKKPPPPRRSNGSVYFSSCKEAHAAGYRNIKRGQPGYRAGLDRDDDGIACEG